MTANATSHCRGIGNSFDDTETEGPEQFMTISFEPHFEVRLRADQDRWEIMVTWGHALRHVVEGLAFRSEHTALRWIERQSSLWLEVQNRGPLERAVRKTPKLVERRRVKSLDIFTKNIPPNLRNLGRGVEPNDSH